MKISDLHVKGLIVQLLNHLCRAATIAEETVAHKVTTIV